MKQILLLIGICSPFIVLGIIYGIIVKIHNTMVNKELESNDKLKDSLYALEKKLNSGDYNCDFCGTLITKENSFDTNCPNCGGPLDISRDKEYVAIMQKMEELKSQIKQKEKKLIKKQKIFEEPIKRNGISKGKMSPFCLFIVGGIFVIILCIYIATKLI